MSCAMGDRIMQSSSDHELMHRICCDRDAGAYEVLADRYRAPLRRHLTALARSDAAAADDLLQETLLRLWTRADSWDNRGAVKAWLFRIATNLALNHLRTVRRRAERPLLGGENDSADEDDLPAWMTDDASRQSGPEGEVLRADHETRLRGLVADLPDSKREVMRLLVDEQMDLQEIGQALGVPEGTVKSRLFHARKRLARQWSDCYGNDAFQEE